MQSVQESPLILSVTLAELLKKDTVKVDLIPEKKGLFLKHVEYQVTSEVSEFRLEAALQVYSFLSLIRPKSIGPSLHHNNDSTNGLGPKPLVESLLQCHASHDAQTNKKISLTFSTLHIKLKKMAHFSISIRVG